MRRAADLLTPDLFEVPAPVRPIPGALAVGPALRGLLSDLLKRSPLSRHDVAARMSELTGDHISKHQLDSWTAESRDAWRFPFEYAPAFEAALETHELGAWYADLRGARLSVGREALEAQLGRVAQMRDELARQERALKKLLGEQA
ncbi:hypothetical protein [Pseudothauera rhizosphaerae]|uniref:Uncharacterized protein n=1 Tax=Pseudothauera rhizosphaerae TaxID=2565932 RepID=A0A4S4ANY4_9RHOO|nr:hypothetical protein [Pseudothauera rhizosphaerae]THF60944.1 hypothetical protein E6O51_11995 [Pseudothauera rhizosphaerae]